jgi:pyruvate-ferredoxin/flavodoxin oxidoreductase
MYRYNPDLIKEGKNPLQLDYKEPSIPVKDYAYNETRYSMLVQSNEERAEELLKLAQGDALKSWQKYSQMAALSYGEAQPKE